MKFNLLYVVISIYNLTIYILLFLSLFDLNLVTGGIGQTAYTTEADV